VCGCKFRQKSYLAKHLIRKHILSGNEEFNWTSFNTFADVNIEKPKERTFHQCELCGKTYYLYKYFKEHVIMCRSIKESLMTQVEQLSPSKYATRFETWDRYLLTKNVSTLVKYK
jgi:hypothetical protein